MYNTQTSTALDRYLTSLQDGAAISKDNRQEKEKKINEISIRQRILQHLVDFIRSVAPVNVDTNELKHAAFMEAFHNEKLQTNEALEVPRHTMNQYTRYGAICFCCSSIFLIIIALVTDQILFNPLIRYLSYILTGTILLHGLFPLYDAMVVYFYWHRASVRCRKLASEIASLQHYKQMIEDQCNDCLRTLKSVAVAEKGYLLHSWMPPISRLEANDVQPNIKCLKLRITLHEIYTKLVIEPEELASPHVNIDIPDQVPSEAAKAPSLLLLALSHQHKAAMQSLNDAIFALETTIMDFDSLERSLHQATWWFIRLSDTYQVTSKLPSLTVVENTTRTSTSHDNGIKTMNHEIQVLRNTLLTANALLFSSQQELSNGTLNPLTMEMLKEASNRTKELLGDCQGLWTNWDALVHGTKSVHVVSTIEPMSEEVCQEEIEAPSVETGAQETQPEEGFTEVFAGLSLGQVGETVQEVSGDLNVVQSFNHVVHELQDVLIRRPVPAERIKGDDSEVLVQKQVSEIKSTGSFFLPTNVSSELKGALGFRPEEEFYVSDDEDSDLEVKG